MRRASNPQGWGGLWSFFLTALGVAVADQLTKLWIRSHLDIGQSLFGAGFFEIVRVQNSGAVFGLFQGQSFILTIVAIVGIALILVYAFIVRRQLSFLRGHLAMTALGLVLGGVIGNLVDRLNPSLKAITDFISIGWWPAFNIADAALTVGVILFAYFCLRYWRSETKHGDG